MPSRDTSIENLFSRVRRIELLLAFIAGSQFITIIPTFLGFFK